MLILRNGLIECRFAQTIAQSFPQSIAVDNFFSPLRPLTYLKPIIAMKRATIKDIAQAAGVSVSTVSRALHNHPDIGDNVKQKVKELAQLLNYFPNAQAVNFRQNRSFLLGLVVPEIHMFFFPSIIRGAVATAEAHGYRLMILPSQESAAKEKEMLRRCIDNRVEGILLALSQETTEIDHLSQAQNMGIPVVLFDKTQNRQGFDRIVINDKAAAFECTEHLKKLNCQNILGVFGDSRMGISQNRVQGFLEACLTFEQKHHYLYTRNLQEVEQLVLRHLEQFGADGIFAMSDEALVGTTIALRKSGIKFPEQCQIVAISDGTIPRLFNPPIPHIQHSGFEVGKVAASILIERIENPINPTGFTEVVVPTKFCPSD